MTVRDEQLEKWPRTPDAIRQHLHDYYACITSIDGHIGRLLQTLRDLGHFENTVIIFSSDNGLAIGSHGLMGKQNLYEDGMKVPLLFCGPGIPTGRSDALVYLLDIFPTVCELVGTDVPTVVDGKSLVPVITGLTTHIRDTLFLAYRDVQRAVRDERWKLIVYPKINKRQLFDLHNDPYEMHDLSSGPRNPLASIACGRRYSDGSRKWATRLRCNQTSRPIRRLCRRRDRRVGNANPDTLNSGIPRLHKPRHSEFRHSEFRHSEAVVPSHRGEIGDWSAQTQSTNPDTLNSGTLNSGIRRLSFPPTGARSAIGEPGYTPRQLQPLVSRSPVSKIRLSESDAEAGNHSSAASVSACECEGPRAAAMGKDCSHGCLCTP